MIFALIFQGDLQVIDQLRRTDLAGRFYFLRYEDAALQPEIELSKLVESLSEKKLSTSKLFCFPSTNDGELSKYQWSFDKNPGTSTNHVSQVQQILKTEIRIKFFSGGSQFLETDFADRVHQCH